MMVMGLNSAKTVLLIGLAEGKLLTARGDYAGAIVALKEGVERQDALVYIEPPSWYHSVRLALGSVLLLADRAVDAETVFREDLQIFPDNAWAQKGLERSLAKQGRRQDAAQALRRFEYAARHADVKITGARF